MNKQDIFNKAVEIALDVFEDDSIVIVEETTADDVEQWDSLSHLNLITDLESEFGIEFTLDEMNSAENFGQLVAIIYAHLTK